MNSGICIFGIALLIPWLKHLTAVYFPALMTAIAWEKQFSTNVFLNAAPCHSTLRILFLAFLIRIAMRLPTCCDCTCRFLIG